MREGARHPADTRTGCRFFIGETMNRLVELRVRDTITTP